MAASAYREALDGADPGDGPPPAGPAGAQRGDVRRPRDGRRRPRRARDRRRRRRRRHPPGPGQARLLHVRLRRSPRPPADEAQRLVLAGERSWKVLDLVALQGLLAHRTGSWFDRMRLELRRTRENPEIANAIFDGYLCPAEYMLYGPTPYDRGHRRGRDLQATARRSGALRAAAFASALIGEAALLSGDLDLAAAELTEASDLHRDLGSAAGEAHSLQRLAEVRLAEGDGDGRAAAAAAGAAAGPVVDDRQAPAAADLRHDDRRHARPARGPGRRRPGRVDARWDDACLFCSIMLDGAGHDRLRPGRRPRPRPPPPRRGRASRRVLWQGTSWEAGMAEARPRWRPPRATRRRRGPGCSRRPSSSSGPASRSTPSAAARRSPPPDGSASPGGTARRGPGRAGGAGRSEILLRPAPPAVVGYVTSPAGRTARGRCCRGRGTTEPEP